MAMAWLRTVVLTDTEEEWYYLYREYSLTGRPSLDEDSKAYLLLRSKGGYFRIRHYEHTITSGPSRVVALSGLLLTLPNFQLPQHRLHRLTSMRNAAIKNTFEFVVCVLRHLHLR